VSGEKKVVKSPKSEAGSPKSRHTVTNRSVARRSHIPQRGTGDYNLQSPQFSFAVLFMYYLILTILLVSVNCFPLVFII
jgi:hypothetical protein